MSSTFLKFNTYSKCILDSQIVKNTDYPNKKYKRFDEGKKVGGIKHRVMRDTNGLSLAINITPANQGE